MPNSVAVIVPSWFMTAVLVSLATSKDCYVPGNGSYSLTVTPNATEGLVSVKLSSKEEQFKGETVLALLFLLLPEPDPI